MTITNDQGIQCPHCGHVNTDGLIDFISTQGSRRFEVYPCEECQAEFLAQEHVRRSWESKAMTPERTAKGCGE